MRPKSPFFLILAVVFFACGSAPIFAEENLSPDGIQKAFKKGTMAAEQGSWDVALKYFDEVLKTDPFYFPAYYNMGLVDAKAGNELAAIAWLKGYLHYTPAAGERAQIEEEITRLEVAVEAKIAKIVAQAEEAALALPEKGEDSYEDEDGGGETYETEPRKNGLSYVSQNLGGIGDMALAEKFVAKHYPGESRDRMNSVKRDYAAALAGSGEIEEALKVARSLAGEDKDQALLAVADGMYAQGDFEGTVKVLADIGEFDWLTSDLIEDVIKELGEGGRAGEAAALYEKIPARPNDPTRYDHLPEVAEALTKAGRREEAIELIKKDESGVGTLVRLEQLFRVAQAYLAAGDIENARRVADALEPETSPKDFRYRLALLYYQVGNDAKYREYAEKITEEDEKKGLAFALFDAACKKEDPAVLEKMASELPMSDMMHYGTKVADAYAAVAWQYFKKGDMAGFDRVKEELASRSEGIWMTGGAFSGALAISALKEGDRDAAEKFLGELGEGGFEWGQVLDLKLKEELRAKRPAGALKTLLGERDQWDKMFEDDWFRAMALRAVREAQGTGDSKAARAFVDTAAQYAQEKGLEKSFGWIGALYAAAGDKKKAAEFRARQRDAGWIDLARSFEKGDTADPAAYFEKNKDKTPEDMPHVISWLAVEYAEGLRKIARKEKE